MYAFVHLSSKWTVSQSASLTIYPEEQPPSSQSSTSVESAASILANTASQSLRFQNSSSQRHLRITFKHLLSYFAYLAKIYHSKILSCNNWWRPIPNSLIPTSFPFYTKTYLSKLQLRIWLLYEKNIQKVRVSLICNICTLCTIMYISVHNFPCG